MILTDIKMHLKYRIGIRGRVNMIASTGVA